MSRVRSPNYPALGLATAIEKARAIHRGEGKNVVSREALAKLIGYGGLNGGSATMLSALGKYGLIESAGDGEARVTDLAMRIIAPEGQEEKRTALAEAAFKPAIFAEIHEKWPDRAPGDDSLRSFLIRKGFTETAAEQVILFYREIIDMAAPAVLSETATNEPRLASTPTQTLINNASSFATSEAAGTPAQLDGAPFKVAFDGLVLTGSIAVRTVRDFDRLMKVLRAQRVALEAMLEDDETGDEESSEEVEPFA